MAATIVQQVSKSTGAGTAASLTIGSGDGWATPTSGNAIVVFANADDYFTSGVPAGFTARVNQGGSAFCGSLCATKQSAGSETSITVTPDTTVTITMCVLEISGLTTTPFDVASTVDVRTSTTAGSLDTNGATTTVADELLIAFWGSSRAGSAGTRSWSGQTNSFTEILDIFTSGGAGTNCGLCLATLVASATGTFNSVATPSADVAGNAFVIGLKIATGGGSTLNGAGNLAVTATASGVGQVIAQAAGVETVTVGRTGVAAVTRPLTGTMAATATITGSAQVIAQAAGNLTVTVSLAGAAAVGVQGNLTITSTLAGAAAVARPVSGNEAVNAAISGVAQLLANADGALATTVTIAGTASVVSPATNADGIVTISVQITGSMDAFRPLQPLSLRLLRPRGRNRVRF